MADRWFNLYLIGFGRSHCARVHTCAVGFGEKHWLQNDTGADDMRSNATLFYPADAESNCDEIVREISVTIESTKMTFCFRTTSSWSF